MRPDPYKQRQSRRHLARQGGTRATVSGKAGNHKQDTKAHEEEKSLGLSHSSRLNQSQKARGNEHQTEQQYQSTFSRRAITSNWDRYAEEEKGEEEGEGREKKSMEHPMGAGKWIYLRMRGGGHEGRAMKIRWCMDPSIRIHLPIAPFPSLRLS